MVTCEVLKKAYCTSEMKRKESSSVIIGQLIGEKKSFVKQFLSIQLCEMSVPSQVSTSFKIIIISWMFHQKLIFSYNCCEAINFVNRKEETREQIIHESVICQPNSFTDFEIKVSSSLYSVSKLSIMKHFNRKVYNEHLHNNYWNFVNNLSPLWVKR